LEKVAIGGDRANSSTESVELRWKTLWVSAGKEGLSFPAWICLHQKIQADT